MKQKVLLIVSIIAAIAMLSCSLGTDDDSDGGGDSVSEVLKSIPEVKPTLPKSLRAPDSKSIRAVPRAFNDITELTAANLNPVRSQAWIDLQDGDDLQLMLNRAIRFIGEYASANDIPVDKEFSVPIDSTALSNIFKVPANSVASVTVSNKCLIKGSDPKDLTLYCKIKVVTSHSNNQILAKVRIVTNNDSTKNLTINLDIDMGNQGTQQMYVTFNTATGDCVSVVSMKDPNGNDFGAMIQQSIVGSGGEVTTINRFTGASLGGSPATHVAFGNDSNGGIASLFSFTDSNTNQTTDYCYQEYYNNEGHLIRRDFGSSSPFSMNSEFLDHQQNLKTLGINTPPSKIYLKQDANSSTTYKYSVDNGATYAPLAGYGYTDPSNYTYGFYFKADGKTDTPLAQGDGLYAIESVSGDIDGDNYIGPIIYSLDYQVPAPTNIFGKSLYIDHEYPLKNILPVTLADYVLIRKETGSFDVQWTDWEGNTINDTLVWYDFYLNKNGTDKSLIEVPLGDIDLRDKLSTYDVYYYSGGTLEKEQGYFFKTTKTSVPSYFTTPDPSAVNAVKDGLTAALDNALTLSGANYESNLVLLSGDSVLAGLTL